ncbi:MAG: secretion system protein E, partial [Methanosarcinales archaeon]
MIKIAEIANIDLPFKPKATKSHDHADLKECGVYTLLPENAKEYANKNPHLLEYLHMVPIDDIGVPKFYPELSKKLKELKNPNLIYPIKNSPILIHIYPDAQDVRNYYIPIEPVLFNEIGDILLKVEEKLVDLVDETESVSEGKDKKKLLIDGLNKACNISKSAKNSPNIYGGKIGGVFSKLKGIFFKYNKNNGSNTKEKVSVTASEFKSIKYIILRDKVGMGVLEPFIKDPYIEDISCDGIGPIFVEHKIFDSLKATMGFKDHKTLDRFVLQLAEKIGKPISYRNPVADATLPDGSRINIVFGTDVSKRGSNFTIRKFSGTPL